MDINTIITFLACIIFLFIFGKLFIWPFKSILKLIINSVLCGVLIYIINIIGMNFGFHMKNMPDKVETWCKVNFQGLISPSRTRLG